VLIFPAVALGLLGRSRPESMSEPIPEQREAPATESADGRAPSPGPSPAPSGQEL